MKAEFLTAFSAMKSYLAAKIPELGNVITHWEDPVLVSKNRSIMLPDSHEGTDGSVNFSVALWVSVAEKNADAIAQTQMNIMEKMYRAVYGNVPHPVISAAVKSADYFDPAPQSPNTGILRVIINMAIDFADDCEED